MLPLWLLYTGFLCVAFSSPSTSPNSAVMPSVSYLDLAFGWNRSSLEKDIAAVFNKVAYGSTTPPSLHIYNKTRSTPSSIPAPTPQSVRAEVTSTTTSSPVALPNTPATWHMETPEYVSRTRFKPPLPPEYTNPFADKPILRGSQSEHSASGAGRRKSQAPPPRPPKPPPEQERIPIRPPDLLVPHDRNKKPLNTPARGTVRTQQPPVTYTQDTSASRVDIRNDTEFDFVPILQNPVVTRILSGSTGRRSDDDRRNATYHYIPEDIDKPLLIDVQPPPIITTPPPSPPSSPTPDQDADTEMVTEEMQPREEVQQEMPQEDDGTEVEEQQTLTDATPTLQESDWDSHMWGVAWDIHVYLMGTLFALLAIISIINFVRTYKRLLPRGYFMSLNSLLLIVGIFRSIFLLYDAYNLNKSYPTVIVPLMLNFAFPCLTSAFCVLFLFLLQVTKVKLFNSQVQSPAVVIVATVSHLLISISLYIVAGCLLVHHSKYLLLVGQAIFLIWGVILAVTYLCGFGTLSRSALRQQCDFLRSPFSKLTTQPAQNPILGLAIRALLAIAMLMLLLVAVQLYGIFGVYGVHGDEPPRPWPWWGFQFSVRVIEVSMCFLMVFVASLRHSDEETHNTSIFTLFSCKNCNPPEETNKTAEDLYPAICSTNQAIHNYSVQTGKKLYDDSYPLNNMAFDDSVMTVRMSLKKTGTMMPTPSDNHPSPSSQRPSSMLFAEDGFVRFRTSADPEQPMEEVLHQSLNRVPHETITPFNLTPEEVCIEQTKVRYRPGMLDEMNARGILCPQPPRMHLLQPGECRGGRQRSAMRVCLQPTFEPWHTVAATTPLHSHLSPATRLHPSESSDSDLASNSEEDQDSPVASSSQDITPDSAVGSDIYSKNGEGPVGNNLYWCDDGQIYGLDLLSRSLINRLKGSNFSLNHLQGYTPLDSICHPNSALPGVVLGPMEDASYFLNACKLEALYNVRPEDESAV